MKRLLLLFAFILAAVFGIQFVLSGTEPESEGIILESKQMIEAGDQWQLSLAVENASAGDTVDVTLLNGLQVFDETLLLGTGGVAVWRIPEGQIIQAGESLIIAQYGDKLAKKSLIVQVGKSKEGTLFTSANMLPAYGEGSATIMFLAQDEWGNSPSVSRSFYLEIRYPDGNPPIKEALTYKDGLGRFQLTSKGKAGRIRLSITQDPVFANLELTQTAGASYSIDLDISPDCVLNDGRDLMTLKASVRDQKHYPVANGTLITFRWSGGLGYGQTIDGIATLRLPAPEKLGEAIYRATLGDIQSKLVSVTVTEDSCE